MSTGKWTMQGVPHRGWTCIDIYDDYDDADRGETSSICEMCEVTAIRYIHRMQHPDYPDVLDCGCICAGYMEGDYVAAKTREKDFKKRRAKRSRWLRRHWLLSNAGNSYLNVGGFNIVIYPRNGHWSARVKHDETGYQRFSQRHYQTAAQAKLAAFDAMNSMKDSAVIRQFEEQDTQRALAEEFELSMGVAPTRVDDRTRATVKK
jgi:hypothetical protein